MQSGGNRLVIGVSAACLCALAIVGCTAGPAARGGPTPRAARGVSLTTLAADYLAIARPANERLDVAEDGYDDNARAHLAAAESALRAQAATERWFDAKLMKIPFPGHIAAVARALVRQNQRRATLTDIQARARSVATLLSFTAMHKSADAAVEVQVRLIRRLLGLQPPSTS